MSSHFLFLYTLVAYSLIIVSSILNFSTATRACGALAGNTILSPAFTVNRVPFRVISATPSNTCTSASNGARCSLNPSPLSKENNVIFPAGLLINCLLITPPYAYSMRESRWSTAPFLNDCSISVLFLSYYHVEHFSNMHCLSITKNDFYCYSTKDLINEPL